MGAEERKIVSARIKKYWASRRSKPNGCARLQSTVLMHMIMVGPGGVYRTISRITVDRATFMLNDHSRSGRILATGIVTFAFRAGKTYHHDPCVASRHKVRYINPKTFSTRIVMDCMGMRGPLLSRSRQVIDEQQGEG